MMHSQRIEGGVNVFAVQVQTGNYATEVTLVDQNNQAVFRQMYANDELPMLPPKVTTADALRKLADRLDALNENFGVDV